jgi:ACS family tartrate transporter-like MFS transporter
VTGSAQLSGNVQDSARQETAGIVLRRISFFLALILFANTLDRVNISFAALRMNEELGLSPEQYGFGVGLFFVSYIICQLPAMVLAERIGLVRAIGFMAIGWGLVSATMSLINSATSFYFLRLILGIMEAGVSPAILLYSSRWCAPTVTARFISSTALALPASFILGAPVSGWVITYLDGLQGWAGWRWMFLIEGGLTIALGVITFVRLDEMPKDAKWLTPAQRTWLMDAIRKAQISTASATQTTWLPRLRATVQDRRVWLLGLVMFCNSMGFYGFLYWLPQVVKMLAPRSTTLVALLASVLPWASAALGMVLVGKHSDRRQEQHVHVAVSALLAATGLTFAALVRDPSTAFIALTIAGFGVGAAQSIFYSIPITVLRGTPQIGMTLALISILANLAGLVGGNIIGVLRETTASFSAAIALLSFTYVLGAVVVFSQRPKNRNFDNGKSRGGGSEDSCDK